LLAPPVERQFGNADLANGIRHRHALAAQNLNLTKLRDDLVGLVSLVCHCGPPSWSKPYFKVDPFNGGGSKTDCRPKRSTRFSRGVAGARPGTSSWMKPPRSKKRSGFSSPYS